jgi:hypothetical protein
MEARLLLLLKDEVLLEKLRCGNTLKQDGYKKYFHLTGNRYKASTRY